MNKEASFRVFYRDNYACLTVYPSEGRESRLYPEDVIGRLKLLDIQGVRLQQIRDIIEEASGEPVPIVLWPKGRKLGPKLSLETSEDNMHAYIIIEPEKQGGEPLSVEMINSFLASNGIVFGIDTSVVQSIVQKQTYSHPVMVASGSLPVDEKSAEPEYLFLTDRGRPFKKLDNDRIDLKELNFIQNKKKEELLGRLLPPVEPRDGTDVFGNSIPAARGVADPVFSAGDGAILSDDGKLIHADTDGNARLDRGRVIVEPMISVENVDYSNGNMDFDGSVDIRGRVADGFSVKAKGDIQIGKSVSRVNITGGGDIVLKAGITGNDEGFIICGGDLYARYIENANILCNGNVYVEEAIMHSSIKAGGEIILKGKRAEIFGGRIFAAGSIKCKKLGSVNEPFTEVFLGIDLDSFTAMEELQRTVSEHNRRVDELDTQIRQIKNALKNDASGEHSDVSTEKLTAALEQLSREAEIRNLKLSDSLKELHEVKRNCKINESSVLTVEQQIYGKVHVYFNHLRWDSPGKGTGKTKLIVKQGKLLEK